jgi:hypothetical protein
MRSTLRVRRLMMAALFLVLAPPLAAQAPALPPAGDPAAVRVILMTMGPGDAVWERFGHNAIWVHDPVAGTDLAYNYGVFDFAQENFFTNFIRGRMMYWVEGWNAYATLEAYRADDRDIWLQELNLTREQAEALRDFLVWNARPENREYRYDYYYDNCSTRVRDAMDRVLDGALRAATDPLSSGTTFRWHTARLTGERAGDVPIFTGLMAGLGPPADREISRWEEMFLPMSLRDRVREATVPGAGGAPVPLVRSETVYHRSTRGAEPAAAPRWWPGYLLAGLALAAGLALLARAAPASRAARTGYAALAAGWLAFAGTFGVILLVLWGLTDHRVAHGNLNLLQLSPLAVPLAVLAPALAHGARWAARPAWWLAAAVVALSLLGLLLRVLPVAHQVNDVVLALAIPANLAVLWSVWTLARRAGEPAPAAGAPPRRPRARATA